MLLIAITWYSLTPPADVWAVHRSKHEIVASHNEIPDLDHDYLEGHLWVRTITGGPDEMQHTPQATFTAPLPMPSRRLYSALHSQMSGQYNQGRWTCDATPRSRCGEHRSPDSRSVEGT